MNAVRPDARTRARTSSRLSCSAARHVAVAPCPAVPRTPPGTLGRRTWRPCLSTSRLFVQLLQARGNDVVHLAPHLVRLQQRPALVLRHTTWRGNDTSFLKKPYALPPLWSWSCANGRCDRKYGTSNRPRLYSVAAAQPHCPNPHGRCSRSSWRLVVERRPAMLSYRNQQAVVHAAVVLARAPDSSSYDLAAHMVCPRPVGRDQSRNPSAGHQGRRCTRGRPHPPVNNKLNMIFKYNCKLQYSSPGLPLTRRP